ncbi:MAG: LysR family transcriptional regulator [Pseudomonadota bacterium]
MKNWDERLTAAYVARLGTVSAAARKRGIHRATVNRHIEVLEAEFGGKLFIRSRSGFTPTDLGREVQRITELAEENFRELDRVARLGGSKLQGEFIISTVELLLPEVLQAIIRFVEEYPEVRTKVITTDAIVRLEYGEADIAFRPGKKPEEPDNVVVPFSKVTFGLFASRSYINQHGKPGKIEELKDHYFVGPTNPVQRELPFIVWLRRHVPAEAIQVEFNEGHRIVSAINAGLGIGFVPHNLATAMPDLVEVMKPLSFWSLDSWRVTHVDIHRTEKIQAFIKILNAT